MVQLSHPYMTTGKTIALTRWTFVDNGMSLLFNILCRFVKISVLESELRVWCSACRTRVGRDGPSRKKLQ